MPLLTTLRNENAPTGHREWLQTSDYRSGVLVGMAHDVLTTKLDPGLPYLVVGNAPLHRNYGMVRGRSRTGEGRK